MIRFFPTIVLALFLEACSPWNISLPVITPVVSPSPLPAIFTPTPQFIPPATYTATTPALSPTISATASFTPELFTPTATPTYAFSSSATTTLAATSYPTAILTQNPYLSVDIMGCNTSLDILHQMGEVTNAYPLIQNFTGINLTNVCATLSATDEARVHPDKTACVAALPAGYQITLKLTVDTGVGQDTAIQVVVNTSEGFSVSVSRSSCRDIGLPGWVPEKVGVIEPIP